MKIKPISKLFLIGLAFFVLAQSAAAQDTDAFVGKWTVEDKASAWMGTTTERVDSTTIRRTDTISAAGGTENAGILEISADGTYRLTYWYHKTVYNQAVTTGKWRVVADGKPFSDKNAIELLDALPNADRSEQDRKWFVWQNEDGTIEGRIPPHDFTGKIELKKGGSGSSKSQKNQKTNAAQKTAKPIPAEDSQDKPEKAKTWTPDAVRNALNGKTKQEVFALLGEPVKAAYGTYSFNGVEKIFPPCTNGCNWKSFAIRFDGAGETVNSVELQYWIVE
jgi:hypothetical protein